MSKELIRAVVYTRFSPRRNSDDSESCQTQLAYCEQYAHKKGFEIIEHFEDKAVSGKDEDRPLLWKAIDALKPGSVLLVYKLDRLARNVYLSEYIRRSVEKMGSRIVAVEGDVEGNGPEQILVRQVLSAFAEYERKIIAIRTKHAMLHHQRCGRRMGRFAPYGTMLHPQDATRLIPNPEEVPAVKTIEALIKKGDTPHEIIVYMNKHCKEYSRGGKPWTQRTLSRMIERLK